MILLSNLSGDIKVINVLKRVYMAPLNLWKSSKKRLQKGLSLIEAAMVLALSAVVVAGVVAYYQSASDNQRTEATISLLTSLLSVIHSTYASQADYSGLNTSLIAKTGALPASFVDKAKGQITTPGGDQVTIAAGKIDGTASNNYFSINFSVSPNLCPIMARLDLGSSFAGLAIGDKNKKLKTQPLNVADSESECSNATKTGDQIALYYQFH